MPFENWFPVTVYYNDMPAAIEINKKIIPYVLKISQGEDYKVNSKSVAGYVGAGLYKHSFLHKHKELKELFVWLTEQVMVYAKRHKVDLEKHKLYIGRAWLTKTEKHGSILLHDHGYAIFSGVYYLQAPEGAGALELTHPIDNAHGYIQTSRIYENFTHTDYQAVEGRVVIFPSYIKHATLRNSGDGERLSISFDVFGIAMEGNTIPPAPDDLVKELDKYYEEKN